MANPKAFTLKGERRLNVLHTECGVCVAFDPLSGGVHPYVSRFKALWDTGATGSVISKTVVDKLGLKPIGKVKAFHANGESTVNVYALNIFLPNQVAIPFLRVTEGILSGFDVLIGMDIITMGDFSITNVGGKTTFSFRVPSIQEIDYFGTPNIPKEKPMVSPSPAISRNAMCPCNSGKKYKHCCGK